MKRLIYVLLVTVFVILCGCDVGDKAMQKHKLDRNSPEYQKMLCRIEWELRK